MKKITIAVDGYSSCGKSTLAKALAKELGYIFIDSGAMYRAVTLFLIENDIAVENQAAVAAALPQIAIRFEQTADGPRTLLNGTDVEDRIRSMDVSSKVSPVATIPQVRRAMVKQQQAMGEQGGIVMDGRDIGTVVFPQAELKIFLTAEMEERVQRRYLQLQQKGKATSRSDIRRNLFVRDYIDATRTDSPLKKAVGAITIDNTYLSEHEQMQLVLTLAGLRM